MPRRKDKMPSKKEFQMFKAVQHIDSLDRPVMGEEGHEVPLGETIVNYETPRLIRIKAWLLSVCKTGLQRNIIELLSNGYEIPEIAKELKVPYNSVTRIIRDIRKQCLELENLNKKLKHL